jgi:drug/metabolite transporter (DMT)-like permease
MLWFWLSLITALTQAIKDVCLKRCLRRMDVGVVMAAYTLAAAVFFWFGVALCGTPGLGPVFWPVLAVGGVLGAVTFYLYGRALRAGDLSLTLPMLAFTPLFLLVTSPLTLGEFPGPAGLLGIVCVVAGSYVLNLRERHKGFWGPIKALWTNRGARLMLLVAAIWSVGANFDKVGLRASSPEFWIAAVYTASVVALLPGLSGRWRKLPGQLATGPWLLVAAGLLEAVGLICQMHALTLTLVPYVIAAKRVSIVFGVLLGAWLFREPDLLHRLPGALIMVAGVFFIAFFG